MFDSVLLPIDLGDPESWEKALPLALKMTGGAGRLHVLGIVHDIGPALVASYLPAGFEETALKKMQADLEAFQAANIPAGANCEVHVGHGHVPETILRTAERLGAGCIVIAAHPHDDLRHLMIGSYAEKVVRHAAVPVLTVR